MVRMGAAILCGLVGLQGCRPESEGRASLVDGPRVLAIRSTPAEAQPDTKVTFEALFVGPTEAPDPKGLQWALCNVPKPIAVEGPIAPACLSLGGVALTSLGQGATATGLIPKDVCRVFGPAPPEPEPGQPSLRPADPDTTGGYYQPVRIAYSVGADAEYATGVTRLACGIGGATQAQAADFAQRHRPNAHPEIERVFLRRSDGSEVDATDACDAGTLSVGSGESVSLRVAWAQCPLTPTCGDGICGAREDGAGCPEDCSAPRGCTGAESYAAFDPASKQVVERREAVRVSWFATGGQFEHERTGRGESDVGASDSEKGWVAPGTPGEVRVWSVIRDDRGGVGWRVCRVTVAAR